MNMTEIERVEAKLAQLRMAQLIANRQFERPVREQLYLYSKEHGIYTDRLDKAMMVYPSAYDAWGDPMYTDYDVEEMLEILNQ